MIINVLLWLLACYAAPPTDLQEQLETTVAGCPHQTIHLDTLHNLRFSVVYPSDWATDRALASGIDLSSRQFPDSLVRGLLIELGPYEDYLMKKNPYVDYHRYQEGRYQGFPAVYLVRDDLWPDEDGRVYWRCELKVHLQQNNEMIWMVWGQRHTATIEPDWCAFAETLRSLKVAR